MSSTTTEKLNGIRSLGGTARYALPRQPIYRMIVLAAALVGSLSLSAVSSTFALWASIALIIVTSILLPFEGLALGIFVAPFQQFAGLGTYDFHLLHGISWSFIAVRLALVLRPHDLRDIVGSKVVILFALFALLVLFRNFNSPFSPYFWLDAGFVAVIFLIVAVLAGTDKFSPDIVPLVATAMVCAVVLSIAFDVALDYLPLPAISPLMEGLPGDKLRLSGLHWNPDATAKFFLAVLSFAVAQLLVPFATRSRVEQVGRWLLFMLLCMSIIATGSKSAVLACLVAVFAPIPLSLSVQAGQRRWLMQATCPRMLPSLKIGVACVLAFVAWGGFLAEPVKRHAAAAWLESGSLKEPRADLREIATSSSQNAVSNILDGLRVGKSFRLRAKGVEGDLTNPLRSAPVAESAVVRTCGISCTGQRDILWKAGFEIVRNHWFWGVGFGALKGELMARLEYPFDSPHNAMLELWGEFGIAGVLLYLSLALLIIRRARTVIIGTASPFIVGTSLYAISILVTELFEPAKFFAMSPHAIWIWTLLALQDRTLTMLRREEPHDACAMDAPGK